MTLYAVPDPEPHKVAPLGRLRLVGGWCVLAVLVGIWWVGAYETVRLIVQTITS